MRHNIPSIKTLAQISSYPKELRTLLETRSEETLYLMLTTDKPFGATSEFNGFSDKVRAYARHLDTPVSHMFHHAKMEMADELCETSGVEYIDAGRNVRSPQIEYLNAGDTYTATLMFVNGRYRVGCYGDIVERGNYA